MYKQKPKLIATHRTGDAESWSWTDYEVRETNHIDIGHYGTFQLRLEDTSRVCGQNSGETWMYRLTLTDDDARAIMAAARCEARAKWDNVVAKLWTVKRGDYAGCDEHDLGTAIAAWGWGNDYDESGAMYGPSIVSVKRILLGHIVR